MTSKLEIIKRACSLSGNGTIDTLDDNDEIARLTDTHYEAIVAELMTGSHRFGKRTATLTALTDEAVSPWTRLYAAPADMLALRYVQTSGGYRIDHEEQDTPQGKAIAVIEDDEAPIAVYTIRVPEARWPADFAMAVQLRMEAVFLAAISEQRDQASRREGRGDLIAQKAKVRDRRASTAGDPGDWDLTQARRSNQRWNQFRAR